MQGHLELLPDLSMLPAAERPVVARALRKKPERRWPSCREFAAQLENATRRRSAETRRLAIIAAVAGLVCLIVVFVRWMSSPGSVKPLAVATIHLQPLEDVTLIPGGSAKVTVRVSRENCPDEVTLTVDGLPADVTAAPVTLEAGPPAGTDTASLTLTADIAAKAGEAHAMAAIRAKTARSSSGFLVRVSVPPGFVRQRPPPLDCTVEGGLSAEAVHRAQEAWATCLNRKVEETVRLHDGVEMTFVLVPAGKFLMGSPLEEDSGGDETPYEVVLTEPFDLGRFEVTQAQYEALTGNNPSRYREKGSSRPVERVSWEEARAFGESLTRKLHDGHAYRLPTEAEWEYSCRGGRPASQPFGVGNGRSLSYRDANFDGNNPYGGADKGDGPKQTCKVGSYPPNALGLFDMHGSVREWCSDRFGPYPEGQATNPGGARGDGPGERIYRGGGFEDFGTNCRAGSRSWEDQRARHWNLGFRLARSLPRGTNQ
jgi:formylglycine-generating enzyme required for sulfatase activity